LWPFLKNTLREILSNGESRSIFLFLVINLGFMGVEVAYGYWTNSLVRSRPSLLVHPSAMCAPNNFALRSIHSGLDLGWFPHAVRLHGPFNRSLRFGHLQVETQPDVHLRVRARAFLSSPLYPATYLPLRWLFDVLRNIAGTDAWR
jgi:hypothetical protein